MTQRLSGLCLCLTLITMLTLLSLGSTSWAQCPEDADLDGYISAACGGDDCDDNDPTVHPGAVETPMDGIDSNCDGMELCWVDADGDGYGSDDWTNLSSDLSCPGVTTLGGDCDDSDSSIYPGAPEIPDNGIDEDCDGVDETVVPVPHSSWGVLKGRY